MTFRESTEHHSQWENLFILHACAQRKNKTVLPLMRGSVTEVLKLSLCLDARCGSVRKASPNKIILV